jgi:serine/threonine-protein kinase
VAIRVSKKSSLHSRRSKNNDLESPPPNLYNARAVGDEVSSDLRLEIGHVLFIDIVGYSKLLINEQSDQLQKLKEIVRGTEQFRMADAEGKLLRLPNGDGGALVFRTNPEAPVLCALEISRALKSYPELRVRMGIHSGPVNEVTDLNEQTNIAGSGINMAQRVMDCGDAGHLLISKHVANDIDDYPQWRPYLHDLGECEVKHGVRVGIVNVYHDGVGNSDLPKKFRALQRRRARTRWTLVAIAVLFLAGVATAFVIVSRKSRISPLVVPEKSVAVLPFENLSDDKTNAYFAEGIQDEILTKLATMADLKVISRTSTAKYKSKPEDLRTVSQQLGVATVLEGTVQRAADKVRVNVQLIDARADSHLWAKTYDRPIKDIFAVESEVSQEIADALQAKLSPTESKLITTVPTKDQEAYDLFLKGEYQQHEALSSLKGTAFDQAANWYRQAIARDPGFVLAIAGWVKSRLGRHHYGEALSTSEVEEVGNTAAQAVRMAPDLAEAHIALGLFYYSGIFRYDQALVEFQRALALQPNNLEALGYVAGIDLRQGRWERSLIESKRCQELDPRNAIASLRVAGCYLSMRMWDEAKRAALHSLALDPHNVGGMKIVFFSDLCGTGDVTEARRVLETFPPETEPTGYIPGGFISVVGLNSYLSIAQRDFGAALKQWEKESNDPTVHRMRLVARTVIHLLAGGSGDPVEIDEARRLLEAKIRSQPDDADSILHLGWINLALKRNAETLKLAKEAVARVPMETDTIAGSFVLAAVAELQARSGETAEAIKTLQTLLSIPAGDNASIQRLKIDPIWDPIRNDPGFQQLIAGKELVGPTK